MQLDLRRQDLQDVSRLWRELGEVRLESPERRIAHLLDGLRALIGAEDACWVSAVRRPTGGWRGWLVTGVQYLYPNEARRLFFNLPPVEGGDSPYMQHQDYSLEALSRRDAVQPAPDSAGFSAEGQAEARLLFQKCLELP